MSVKVIKAREQKRKTRVCAYIRVSSRSDSQAESLENQKQYFEELYRNRTDVDFVGVYRDQGISGSKANRPDFQRMIDACKAGKIDQIHTKSISRFARNTILVLEISRELKELGIDIYFEEQNIHTLSSDGEVMLSVLASLAEEELESMSLNQRWGFQKKFQRGELIINTKRFMGYDIDESGELAINPEEAIVVRRIFELYLSGVGTHRIAKLLNSEGIPTVTNSRWHEATVRNMLRNEKYKGAVILQKYYQDGVNGAKRRNTGQYEQYYIEENHPPIVSKEMWQKVQDRFASFGNQPDSTKRYRFTSMLRCQHCGANLRRQISYKKKIVWCCAKYLKQGKESCIGMRVAEEAIQHWQLTEPVTVIERSKDGKKYYSYSGQEESGSSSETRTSQDSSGSLLSSVDRSRRAAIKL